MSRLYVKHSSDLRKGTGHGASQEASASVYWGSAGDSKLCASIEVVWIKGEDKPSVVVTMGESPNINVYNQNPCGNCTRKAV